jgi:hypothetical protein
VPWYESLAGPLLVRADRSGRLVHEAASAARRVSAHAHTARVSRRDATRGGWWVAKQNSLFGSHGKRP